MKKIAVLFLILILASCSDDADDNAIQNPNRELSILKVDFLTHTFEGGNSFEFNNIAMTNTLPIDIDPILNSVSFFTWILGLPMQLD